MLMKRMIFLMGFIVLFWGGCSKKQATKPEAVGVEDLLPKDGEISGWKLTGNRWNASSSGELNQAIDGEEPFYTRNGFVEGMMREYEGKVLNILCKVELRIFDQGKSENAKALFDELVLQLINPINWAPSGTSAGKVETTTLSRKILFRDARYFVQLIIDSSQEEALNVLKTFAGNVENKVKS